MATPQPLWARVLDDGGSRAEKAPQGENSVWIDLAAHIHVLSTAINTIKAYATRTPKALISFQPHKQGILTWYRILIRSAGAIQVLAIAPASPPETIAFKADLALLCCSEGSVASASISAVDAAEDSLLCGCWGSTPRSVLESAESLPSASGRDNEFSELPDVWNVAACAPLLLLLLLLLPSDECAAAAPSLSRIWRSGWVSVKMGDAGLASPKSGRGGGREETNSNSAHHRASASAARSNAFDWGCFVFVWANQIKAQR